MNGLCLRSWVGPRAAVIVATAFGGIVHAGDLPVLPDGSAGPCPLPPAGYLDEAAFRDGLRQRGLTAWLEQYNADTPPADEVDAQLRRREALLASLDDADLPAYDRRDKVTEARAILTDLVAKRTQHPASLRWLFERARDDVERYDPAAFDAMLLYELPGRDRGEASRLSTSAIESLEPLRSRIEQTWKAVESLDEPALAAATASGSLHELEKLDQQSAVLLTWSKLYLALSRDQPAADRKAAFSALLTEVTQRRGWTEVSAGREAQRANALLLAAIAARGAGQFDAAGEYARQSITAITQVADAADRSRLRNSSLLAVLEQIRVLRDASKKDEALQAVAQARQWAQRIRAKDVATALAITLVEQSILAPPWDGQGDAATSRPLDAALAPLQVFADAAISHREAVYGALAGAVTVEPAHPAPRPFVLQLAAGGALSDVLRNVPPPQRAKDPRVTAIAKIIERVIVAPPAETAPATVGELMFLLGRARYLAGQRLAAADVLARLVEQYPQHDRSPMAGEQSAAVAQEMLRESGSKDVPQAWAALLRAARLVRTRSPDSPAARRLQYSIGMALEHGGQFLEAAKEYAAVPGDDVNAHRAALRRIECLRDTLRRCLAESQPHEADARELAGQALEAARTAVTLAAKLPPTPEQDPDGCLVAQIVLLLADLLNDPAIARPAEAVDVLKDFERRFARCPGTQGTALRERILALRQLKRMGDARQVVEQFLAADPDHAGPVMTKLLEAMHDEMERASDRGEDPIVKSVSEESVRLARMLLDWSAGRPGQIAPRDLVTIRVWLAWSFLNAGHPAEAIEAFTQCQTAGPGLIAEGDALHTELRLGLAQCLLALDRAAEALPIFTEVWQRTTEESSNWWQAFVGSLQCHTRLKNDPVQILQSIRQRRHLSPQLGSPRWQRSLEAIEKANTPTSQTNHE